MTSFVSGAWVSRGPDQVRGLLTIAVLVVVTLLAGQDRTDAHRRDFPFTYDWLQPSPGEHEIELQSHVRFDDSSLEQQLEFEYGISARLMVAPYLVFENASGEGLKYSAFKVESRYQLGHYETGRVLPGLYIEYEKPSGETSEIEGKLILSRYDRWGGDFSLNLITERSLGGGTGSRWTYSAGYARPIGFRRIRAGVEWIRDIDDGRINAGPVVAFSPTLRTWLVGGVGLPVNHQENNGSEARLLFEYEWH